MTKHSAGPRRRDTDTSRMAHFRVWWYEVGSPIAGIILVVTALFVGVLAFVVFSNKSRTDDAASASCKRSAIISPYLLKDYRTRGVFPTSGDPRVPRGDVLAYAASSIPDYDACP
jgi:hypothetical protein